MYRLTRCEKQPAYALHLLTFPHDHWEAASAYWICYDEKQSPVGFCSARVLRSEPGVFLTRAGVLPCAHGHGLQRRMINVRVAWAHRQPGVEYVITYATYDNHKSIANLLRCGFKFTNPSYLYGGKGAHYFIKEL